MAIFTLTHLANGTNGAPHPPAEWQRYTLDSITIGGNNFTVDQLHAEMVTVMQQYAATLANLGVAPAGALQPGAGISGWATLALKNHPNPANQNQWAHDWWLGVAQAPTLAGGNLAPGQTNPAGEFFHVTGGNGYVEQNPGGNPQAVNYGAMYTAAGNTNAVTDQLIAIVRNRTYATLPGNNAQKLATRQIAAALFLAEVHRNHLTLLVNLAMFDLIKAGAFPLNYFLGNFHPMAQGGPMAHIGNGTAGAAAGANAGTRTRTLEASILMYWLKLADEHVTLNKGADHVIFNSSLSLGAIRQNVPSFDHALSATSDRSISTDSVRQYLLKGLLTKNGLLYK